MDAGGLAKDWVGLMARGLLGRGLYVLQLSADEGREVANLVSGGDRGRGVEWMCLRIITNTECCGLILYLMLIRPSLCRSRPIPLLLVFLLFVY